MSSDVIEVVFVEVESTTVLVTEMILVVDVGSALNASPTMVHQRVLMNQNESNTNAFGGSCTFGGPAG